MRTCKAHGAVVCECGAQMARCKCRGPVPVQKILCIHSGTAEELFDELVFNAAAAHEEHPARMVWACQRIAKERRCKVDDVFSSIRHEVKERTGRDRMPGEALNIRLN